jgi:uncharacterized membrane protein
MRLVRAFLAACVIAAVVAPAALAQGPLEMTTDYPSVVADPGAKVTFPVKVVTTVAEQVNLSVTTQPDGWTTTLRGGGSTISALTTKTNPDVAGEISGTFNAEVDVPEGVTPGSNEIVVHGQSASGTQVDLHLVVVTEEQEAGAVTLTSDFPSLQGATTATFRFNLTLTNDTNQQQTFGLETDAPAGWTVTATPSGETQAASAVVDAGADQQIEVTAKPPADAPAGDNQIVVHAVGSSVSADAELSVTITGSFAMTMDTADGRLNARTSAGGSTTVNLVITNNGTAPLSDIKLTSTPPQKWTVTFDTPEVPAIAPQSEANAVATITAPSDALAGDYVITIRAAGADVNDSVEIRTTVETSPLGYLIGIAVLVIVAVGLFFVFQRYGRR